MKNITISMHNYNFHTLDCMPIVYYVALNSVDYIMKSEKMHKI